MIIEGGAGGDSHNIWIDHDTFSYGGTDISISSSVFEHAFYAVLVTAAGPDFRTKIKDELPYEQSEELRPQGVTVYDNLFFDIRRRSARGAYCKTEVHEFNNVIDRFGEPGGCSDAKFGFGPSAVNGAELLLERNYIAAYSQRGSCTDAVDFKEVWPGYVRESGDVLANGAVGATNDPTRVFRPPYTHSLLPATNVRDFVTRCAGVHPAAGCP